MARSDREPALGGLARRPDGWLERMRRSPAGIGIVLGVSGLGAALILLSRPGPPVPPLPRSMATSKSSTATIKPAGSVALASAVESPALAGDPGNAAPRATPKSKDGKDAPVPVVGEGDEEDEGDAPRGVSPAPSQEGLTRADILAGIGTVAGPVMSCYGPDQRGTVKLSIASSGHVTGATVGGGLAVTRAAACITTAASEAVFRSTKRDSTVLWQLPLRGVAARD